jgi:NAD(P)-dependent dehydrogenase (short-subunit alcohol dehydrogenase family)
MNMTGKSALITGGASGIGLATARLLVAEGARVAITDRDPALLNAARTELGSSVRAFPVDVTAQDAMEHVISRIMDEFETLDILFANAGVLAHTPVGETPAARFAEILNTNVTGTFLTVQAAVPFLSAGASVVLSGAAPSMLNHPGLAAYAASKAAIPSMARVLAAELAPLGVRVNVVISGPTRTNLGCSDSVSPMGFVTMQERLASRLPLGRVCEAVEIARVVLFLASDDAAHIHATEIVVDGGASGSFPDI